MIKCHFCPAAVPDVGAAIDANWIPAFWHPGRGVEVPDPVCQACTRAELVEDPDTGEYELAPPPVVLVQAPAE